MKSFAIRYRASIVVLVLLALATSVPLWPVLAADSDVDSIGRPGYGYRGHFDLVKTAITRYGQLPLWTTLRGAPFVANPGTSPLYPGATLIALLSANGDVAVRWVAFVHLVFISIAGYVLTGWGLRLSRPAAVVGGIVAAFGPWYLYTIQHGTLLDLMSQPWMYLALALIWRALADGRKALAVAAGVSAGVAFYAGGSFNLLYLGLVVALITAAFALEAVYLGVRRHMWQRLATVVMVILTFSVSALVFAAAKLVPSAEYVYAYSDRADVSYETAVSAAVGLRQIGDWLRSGYEPLTLVPTILLIVVGGLLGSARRRGAAVVFGVGALLFTWMTWGPNAPVDLYYIVYRFVPGFKSNYDIIRMSVAIVMCLVPLAAMGVDVGTGLIRWSVPRMRLDVIVVGTRRFRRLALITLIATTLLLVAAGLIVQTTRWERETSVFPWKFHGSVSVGPFNAGEAFEQNFVVPVDRLSSLTIQVRTPEGQRTGPDGTLIFRLYNGNQIVRQGLVGVANLDHVIRRVRWSFVPILSSANIEHRLQVVVGDGTKVSVYTVASITNKWSGSIVSNGIPAVDHIDLAIDPGRELSATQVVLGAVARAPIGLVGIALTVVAATAAFGAGVLASLRLPKNYPRSAAGLLAGLTAAVIHVAIASGQFGGSPPPELASTFWIWILISLIMLSRLPWAILSIGLSTIIFHIAMTLRALSGIYEAEPTSDFWLWLLVPIVAVGVFPWVVTGIAWTGYALLPDIWAKQTRAASRAHGWGVLDPHQMDKWRNRGTSALSRLGWGAVGVGVSAFFLIASPALMLPKIESFLETGRRQAELADSAGVPEANELLLAAASSNTQYPAFRVSSDSYPWVDGNSAAKLWTYETTGTLGSFNNIYPKYHNYLYGWSGRPQTGDFPDQMRQWLYSRYAVLGVLDTRYVVMTASVVERRLENPLLDTYRLRPLAVVREGILFENESRGDRVITAEVATLLIGNDDRGEFLASEALYLLGRPEFDPAKEIIIAGHSEYIDDYSVDWLERFYRVILINPRSHDADRAAGILREYVARGGYVDDITGVNLAQAPAPVPWKWTHVAASHQTDEMNSIELPLPGPGSYELMVLPVDAKAIPAYPPFSWRIRGVTSGAFETPESPLEVIKFDAGEASLLLEYDSHGEGQFLFHLRVAAEPGSVDVAGDSRSIPRVYTSPNEIRFEIEIDSENGFVLLADPYLPGWQATANGVDVPIYIANGIGRGLILNGPGTHTIEMHYAPRSHFIGWMVTILGVVGLTAAWIVRRCWDSTRRSGGAQKVGDQEVVA